MKSNCIWLNLAQYLIRCVGNSSDLRVSIKIILKWKYLRSRRFTEISYLTKTGPPENTAAINRPLREFPMNSAVLKIKCPISIKKPNRNIHTLPLKALKKKHPFAKLIYINLYSGCCTNFPLLGSFFLHI